MDSVLVLIDLLCTNGTVSVVVSMAVLQALCMFQGGIFISYVSVPVYWQWLQSISIFAPATRSMLIAVMEELTYECVLNASGECLGPLGDVFPCDARAPAPLIPPVP